MNIDPNGWGVLQIKEVTQMVSKKKPPKPESPKSGKGHKGGHRGATSAPSSQALGPEKRRVMVLVDGRRRRMVWVYPDGHEEP